MLLDKIGDELTLGETEGPTRAVPVNLHAKELSGWPQITKSEVGRELMNDRVQFGGILAS